MNKEDFSDVIPSGWSEEDEAAPLKTHSTINHKKDSPTFLLDKKSAVVPCGENILRAVKWLFPTNFRNNEWTNRSECNLITGKWHNLTDYEHMYVRSELAKTFSHQAIRSVSLNAVVDAIHQLSYENKIDEAKEFFLDLYTTWDGTPRLDTWLTSTYNVPTTEYYRAVGSNFIKGIVKRVFEPGCKFDTVMVLEGEQGIGKSTSLEVLGGDWHTTLTAAPDNKDFFMTMQGKMIVEFSEGETLSRTEVKQLKSVISTRVDTFRPPYAHEMRDFPRRCVFAMSTNQTEYLKDETGNRRWLPVACEGKINIDWLRENRSQLFAEALVRVLEKDEAIHEFPVEETKAMQEARLIEDPERENIVDWYFLTLTEFEREQGISTNQVFAGIQPSLGYMKLEKPTKADQMRIGGVLQNTLFLKPKPTRLNGILVRRYFPSEKTLAMAPTPSEIQNEFVQF